MKTNPIVEVRLNAVIVAITDEQPKVLTVASAEGSDEGAGVLSIDDGARLPSGLPSGPLDAAGDRTLELALRRWVAADAGLEVGYVEQLYTFGDRFRDPRELSGGVRVVTVAYLALTKESAPAPGLGARWQLVYSYFPWEDWRRGRPPVVETKIEPILERWIGQARSVQEKEHRRERAAIVFGYGGSPWDEERVLERYELLYEIGLVAESRHDYVGNGLVERAGSRQPTVGLEMALDHRRILATAVGRIRAKIKYRPVIFELMDQNFTLLELQRAVEALAGIKLHKQNFRRLVERGGLVEGTGMTRRFTGGRPAELFRFRRDVLLERPAPGVGLPGVRRQG